MSPGFGDNGEGSNGPDILDAQSNSVLPFLIQRLHSGFLKSLDGAHVAWGTVYHGHGKCWYLPAV